MGEGEGEGEGEGKRVRVSSCKNDKTKQNFKRLVDPKGEPTRHRRKPKRHIYD